MKKILTVITVLFALNSFSQEQISKGIITSEETIHESENTTSKKISTRNDLNVERVKRNKEVVPPKEIETKIER